MRPSEWALVASTVTRARTGSYFNANDRVVLGMDSKLLLGAALVLLCVRDAKLLASRRRLAVVFAPLVLIVSAGCGLLAERLSATEAEAWLRDPRLWLPATAIHALLALWAIGRGRRQRPADWVSVAPTPILCIGIVGAARLALVYLDGASGLAAGLLIGLAYGISAAALATWDGLTRRGLAPLRFAAVSHFSALLLIPAAGLNRPLDLQGVDWRVTGAVLAAVGSLVGASFLWHRYRSRAEVTAK